MRFVTYLVTMLALVALFVVPHSLLATTETTIGGSLVATIEPHYPKAGEMVTIRLQGYGYDLESSRISWVVNKQVELQGMAKKEHAVRVGAVGSQTTVSIVVETLTGKQIIKNITFRPADIDLIWEADTYVPAEYEGARLPSLGSTVTVTAIPNLRSGSLWVRPENIIFTWKKDFKNLVRESGRGRDSLTFVLDQSSTQIEVTAQSAEFGIIATTKAVIKTFQPEILVYPVKPLVGIIKTVIGNLFAAGADISGFKVEPYFVPNDLVKGRLLRYEWTNNTSKVPFVSRDGLFRFENIPTFEFGSTTMSVKVYNTLEDTSLGQKSWTVERGRTESFFE